ncbi:HAD family hydrolase [Terrilactibacillus laevilacticus]|uniref:HAD family hydrolase n=1 Tax=Terrilactibacillus laevilacticus TaxID=1380157 RepID=UPI0011471FCE|nr:HAD family hydrolase [Terrilactibacillus laevilacticus]
MPKYKIILFDLDGTLSDPKIGITKSVQYALKRMGINEPDIDKLECFIGPPLQVSFTEYYNFDQTSSKTAIDFYRERFKDKGIFENELYRGIPELLNSLKEQQYTLVVATSKPTVYAEQILKYFKIDQYFDLVVGSHLDGTRSSKTEIINFILDRFHDHKKDHFVMIGDREHDLIGAHNAGIDSIGVQYGFGSYDELQSCKPTYLAKSIEDIKTIFSSEKLEKV